MTERRDAREGQTTMRELALLVPRIAKLLTRLLRDQRVGARNKATLLLATAYLLSPLDLIPDFVPGLGQLDDLVVAVLALDQMLNDVPEDVVREHWDGDDDILEVVREVLRQSATYVPAPVKKLFSSH
jgi:uncharacterized membrane protein YkvA (DUF1232 family)